MTRLRKLCTFLLLCTLPIPERGKIILNLLYQNNHTTQYCACQDGLIRLIDLPVIARSLRPKQSLIKNEIASA